MRGLEQLKQQLESQTQQSLKNAQFIAVGGGDINRAYRLQTEKQTWFVKLNRPELVDMFNAEAAGLTELAKPQAVRVPQVIGHGQTDDYAYLALEYLPLKSLSGEAEALFGQQLAKLHQQQQPYFGWHRNNTIGSTPQHNDRYQDWLSFWREQRLGKQLEFTVENGYRGSLQTQGARLLKQLHKFFSNYNPQPALLHGDLWCGNAAADANSQPVMFDPACYYGDREADLAMTELFGGFGSRFYQAYQQHYPLDSGYKIRKELYNLYHILNHLNLFGSGYLGRAESMIDKLLSW